MAATGCMARIWKEDDSVLTTDKLTRKADHFISGPCKCTWRELETGQ
jgi:hypothetical protein